jgi:hypothetical protein
MVQIEKENAQPLRRSDAHADFEIRDDPGLTVHGDG